MEAFISHTIYVTGKETGNISHFPFSYDNFN